jgi:carbon monoxide dehydrogenase subunit G
MASIIRNIRIDAPPDDAWAAVRDVGAAHTRLTPGVLTDCKLENGVRTVAFASGFVARERIIDVNDDERRVAYTVMGEPFQHHNASMQVVADGGGSRIIWITDLLPEAIVPQISAMVDQGAAAMKRALGRSRNAA